MQTAAVGQPWYGRPMHSRRPAMLVHLRARGAIILGLVAGIVVLSAVSAVSAVSARPAAVSSPLTFITDGLSCTNGVCALGSGSVGANYGQNIAITGGS